MPAAIYHHRALLLPVYHYRFITTGLSSPVYHHRFITTGLSPLEGVITSKLF